MNNKFNFERLGILLSCAIGLYIVLEMFGLGYLVDYGILLMLTYCTSKELYNKVKVVYQGIKHNKWFMELYSNKVEISLICIYSLTSGILMSRGSAIEVIVSVLLVLNALIGAYLLKKNGRLK